ncbi:uncharacterized protein LOC135131434 [Zophobas morio]|uniref:uncharacterized protein LOC135131434 n=1 Tax=Zophobas morio TaxID=2755281 RepID=UPI0030834FAD
MGLGHVQVALLALGVHCVAALFERPYHSPPFTPAHFYPKPPPIKLPSLSLDDKFYFSLSSKPKKTKYFVGKIPDYWKAIPVEKKGPALAQEPFRPVLHAFSPPEDDVKPVTEHIEGDLMYDFRTNTHSF